ncbi:MAG: hydantoinase/oxoprolinase N-terminal domain-containing protein, partial [Flavobacteriaceae bacterium]
MKSYKIGIDVGGTNTDCVLVSKENEVIAKTKHPTTADISTGIENAMKHVLESSTISPSEVRYVMLGTTHCTNAIVERKHLNKVGIIRICKPASQMIPPLSGFPEDLKAILEGHVHMVKGGYEFDGRPIHALDEVEIADVLYTMKGKVEAIAITGIFSKINPDQEQKVAAMAREILDESVAISMSHQIGSLGLLERENATILNAMLHDIAIKITNSFQEVVKRNKVDAQLYFGQNDGTLMSIENARQFPVLTIACGPTNSIRGAGALSGVKNGIVIDVGGTTSDAGVLVNQFPRESNRAASVGGVNTNFRMPDVVAIGLGGGTIVAQEKDQMKVGPQSVGFRITEEAFCFGGDTCTLSDYAILNEQLSIEGTLAINAISGKLENQFKQDSHVVKQQIGEIVSKKINQLIDKVKTDNQAIPVVLVGGGSPILPDHMEGVSEIVRPPHYEVANAYGACIAQIGGEAERVYNLAEISREDAIEEVKGEAIKNAVTAGAKEASIEVLTINDTPLAYLPNATKVKVKVCGEL